MGIYSEHSTYVNNKNIEVPSVTTIIKILNKPFIAKWANSLGWKRQSYDKVLEESANKGTFTHELIHEYLFKEGKKFDLSNPDKLNYLYEVIEIIKEFSNYYDFEPVWGEKSFSLEKFGGTVDLYCKLDGLNTIIDFKTSKKFYSSHFIQLGAYIQLLENNGYEVEQVGILRIRDGMYDLRLMKRNEMERYIEIFNKLVDLFHLVYDLNQDWGDLI